MIARFSLYDLIAAVIPGILFIWGASVFSASIKVHLTGGLTETSVLVALGYVTGLILQGISQGLTEKILLRIWGGFPSARWLLPDDDKFSKDLSHSGTGPFFVCNRHFILSPSSVLLAWYFYLKAR